jgi:cytochrome c551/c552
MIRRILRIVLLAAVAVLIGAQFFQPRRTNPVSDPAYSFEAVSRPPAEVTSILNRACRDCHSNETVWPWYSKVAPASWLVAQDVQQGRTHLNFSEWSRFGPEMARSRLREVCEQVRGAEMPLWYYVPMHPSAKLSLAEIDTLCTQYPGGRVD